MKNRAKCKLCFSIIESFHEHDYVECKCGEISINGGQQLLKCSAKNWHNFLRVDDLGNEIIVKVQEEQVPEISTPLSKKEQIDMLDSMIKNIENLPQSAMSLPINHYDLYSFMLVISSILRSDVQK